MTDEIKIRGFKKISRKQIARYLLSDIDDDWFQDPIRYQDFIALKKEYDVITKNIHENVGRYQPNHRDLYYVPKSNFTLRYSLETDYYDRWIYFFLCLPLMQKFDQLLSRRVYSHRFAGTDKYLFHNRIKQWEKFEGIVRIQASGNVIVETDIQNYYENISLRLLEQNLNDCLRDAKTTPDEMAECRKNIDFLVQCLKSWAFDQERALPQNRDCSSFLANVYMRSIDELMINAGFNYYRYMDDIRIVCKDKFEARRAVMFLVNELRHKNLSLNGKKTKIIEPGSLEHNKISTPEFDLSGIDALLTTKRKANVAAGYNQLREQCIRMIENNSFDTREFRFCINRLSKLARCKNYKVPHGFWDPLISGVVKSIIDSPTATDRAFEFLASITIPKDQMAIIEEYLTSTASSIYAWQNYWLWKLMIIWGHSTDKLIAHAKIVTFGGNNEIPNVAGGMLYVSKFGTADDKVNIKNMFQHNSSSYLQRHILLSIKDLDWLRDGVECIKDKMPERLAGSYRHIKEHITEIVSPPPMTSINELITSIHQYD